MLTGDIRNQIDRIWDAFWSGGISNPLVTGSGHEWLMNPINEMIRAAAKGGRFRDSKVSLICPFIEPMGSG
jgi:hypothetical protein